MEFDARRYGDRVARILALDGGGNRLMPFVATGCPGEIAATLNRETPDTLFPNTIRRRAAMAGLWLYFSGFEQAHTLAQDDHTTEGSLWHAILHRMEPDAGNSSYWYRAAGPHVTHEALAADALGIVSRYPDSGFQPRRPWDPFEFVHFCERARQKPASPAAQAALEIQRAEWQLLFDYCARVRD
jgi:hypothetical protein